MCIETTRDVRFNPTFRPKTWDGNVQSDQSALETQTTYRFRYPAPVADKPTMRARSLRPGEWDAEPAARDLYRRCVWEACGASAEDVHLILKPETALCVPLELCGRHHQEAQDPSTVLLVTMTTGIDGQIVAARYGHALED